VAGRGDGCDLAVFDQQLAIAEDEVDIARNQAVCTKARPPLVNTVS
jgi:hypothetical protein